MNGNDDGRYYKFAHPNSAWGNPNIAHIYGWDLVCCVPQETVSRNMGDGLVVYRRASLPRRFWRWMRRTKPSQWFEKPPF